MIDIKEQSPLHISCAALFGTDRSSGQGLHGINFAISDPYLVASATIMSFSRTKLIPLNFVSHHRLKVSCITWSNHKLSVKATSVV
jgi:hypothetical protein